MQNNLHGLSKGIEIELGNILFKIQIIASLSGKLKTHTLSDRVSPGKDHILFSQQPTR